MISTLFKPFRMTAGEAYDHRELRPRWANKITRLSYIRPEFSQALGEVVLLIVLSPLWVFVYAAALIGIVHWKWRIRRARRQEKQ